MLARRFTIICLLVALFGMLFAQVVESGTHDRQQRSSQTFRFCSTKEALCDRGLGRWTPL